MQKTVIGQKVVEIRNKFAGKLFIWLGKVVIYLVVMTPMLLFFIYIGNMLGIKFPSSLAQLGYQTLFIIYGAILLMVINGLWPDKKPLK